MGGRMFALINLAASPGFVNPKCDPSLDLELLARYTSVRPGYHADKHHRNTVDCAGDVPATELQEMVEHSYDLVLLGLPRGQRTGCPATDRRRFRPLAHRLNSTSTQATPHPHQASRGQGNGAHHRNGGLTSLGMTSEAPGANVAPLAQQTLSLKTPKC